MEVMGMAVMGMVGVGEEKEEVQDLSDVEE